MNNISSEETNQRTDWLSSQTDRSAIAALQYRFQHSTETRRRGPHTTKPTVKLTRTTRDFVCRLQQTTNVHDRFNPYSLQQQHRLWFAWDIWRYIKVFWLIDCSSSSVLVVAVDAKLLSYSHPQTNNTDWILRLMPALQTAVIKSGLGNKQTSNKSPNHYQQARQGGRCNMQIGLDWAVFYGPANTV